ncbi:hypothetical protein [Microbulbifer variabilis]|uniref:hypothetical protein n=1 Tax=Microbulbifer variabilis TaxID=266805 RepID=UPI00037B6566|nr:hypothetical protein [Microbulbifer variabilis]
MNKAYEVIDHANSYTGGYIKEVFLRDQELKGQIGYFKWLIITLVEMIVGSELLESLIVTGSVPPHNTIEKIDSSKYGSEMHLSLHIPAGLVTGIFKRQILEVLYFKFYCRYEILDKVGEPFINHRNRVIDCTRVRFRARKSLFYQFIALRRVYDLFWLVLNLLIDVIVFFITTDIKFALLAALIVEALRRILRV